MTTERARLVRRSVWLAGALIALASVGAVARTEVRRATTVVVAPAPPVPGLVPAPRRRVVVVRRSRAS